MYLGLFSLLIACAGPVADTATVTSICGDTVVVDYQGTRYGIYAACYQDGPPTPGDTIVMPWGCQDTPLPLTDPGLVNVEGC